MESILKLSVGGLPPLSARGCTQTLIPMSLGQQQRTLNGDLVHWGNKGLKYRSHIHCQDQAVLATDGLAPGVDVVVECIQPLWQRVMPRDKEEDHTTVSVKLDREPVEGSIVAMTSQRSPVAIVYKGDGVVQLPHLADDIFVCYRPHLCMKVTHYELFTNEWGLSSGWKLDLEEV